MAASEQLPFAYPTSELSRKFLTAADFPFIASEYNPNWAADRLLGDQRFNGIPVNPEVARESRLDLGTSENLDYLVTIAANDHPGLVDLGFTDVELRATLFRSAEARKQQYQETISSFAIDQADRALGLAPRVSATFGVDNLDLPLLEAQRVALEKFQEDLIARVSPVSSTSEEPRLFHERTSIKNRGVRLVFPPELITQPVIYNLGRKFDITTKIRRANVTRTHGWVDTILGGDPSEIEQAVKWLIEQGVSIQEIPEKRRSKL
jgi:L-aspartate semialdehyde sulfurtransferase ferredoxin